MAATFHRAGAPAATAGTCGIQRRRAVLGAALLAGLAACSKDGAKAPAGSKPEPGAAQPGSSRLAFEKASRGNGFVVGQPMAARSLLVFFDPQCPHCASLWVAGKPLLDRVRMVWMPVAFIAPTSGPQGALLLASPDPAKTMDLHESLLASGRGGLDVATAADPALLAKVRANTELWKALDGSSVPQLFYRVAAEGPYGMQSGGMPTAQLAQLLEL